jgi:hypothetical protein
MPKVRTSKLKFPDGWELIEPTMQELEQKMREGEAVSYFRKDLAVGRFPSSVDSEIGGRDLELICRCLSFLSFIHIGILELVIWKSQVS